ncbi:MAG: DUF6325 family protein [Acidimicrobiales bacterium]
MSDTAPDVHGPIDFVLVEFSADRAQGKAAAALLDLVEAGTIRLYDLLVIHKLEDGSFESLELSDLPEPLQAFAELAGARSGLVSDEDIAESAEVMDPGKVAALIIYENAWAVPFVAAALEADAQLIASERIPATVVMEALDALEAAEADS